VESQVKAVKNRTTRTNREEPTPVTGNYTSWRDEKELVDLEPEEPASFLPVEDKLSVEDYDTPAHGDAPASNIVVDTEILVHLAEGYNVAGQKRRQNFSGERETSRKASKAGPEAEGGSKQSFGVGSLR
jgi:hypothetical protein